MAMIQFMINNDIYSVLRNMMISVNWWAITAIVEFLFILFLLLTKKNSIKRNNSKPKEKILDEEIDFRNILNSSFNASKIYNDLIRKCHPDRFTGDIEKIKIANQISAEITQNKNNIKKLNEIAEKAKHLLNIDNL